LGWSVKWDKNRFEVSEGKSHGDKDERE
jgi:hypothetical protein